MVQIFENTDGFDIVIIYRDKGDDDAGPEYTAIKRVVNAASNDDGPTWYARNEGGAVGFNLRSEPDIGTAIVILERILERAVGTRVVPVLVESIKTALGALQPYLPVTTPMVRIVGCEAADGFLREVPEDYAEVLIQDMWDHPSKYQPYPDGSEDAYYRFLKYLWVHYPDGTEKRLAEVAHDRS